MKPSRSFLGVIEAVGLFGLQMYTSPVEPLAFFSMEARSCADSRVRGMDTTSPPLDCAYRSIASKVGDACSSRLPFPRKAIAQTWRFSREPHPNNTCSGLTR